MKEEVRGDVYADGIVNDEDLQLKFERKESRKIGRRALKNDEDYTLSYAHHATPQ